MINGLLTDEAVDKLSIIARAKLKRLPDYLTVIEICDLCYPPEYCDPVNVPNRLSRLRLPVHQALYVSLTTAIKLGELIAEKRKKKIFIPDAHGHSSQTEWPEIVIYKNEFIRYLELKGEWPLKDKNCLWNVWFDVAELDESTIEIKPKHKRPIDSQRDDDVLCVLKKLKMTLEDINDGHFHKDEFINWIRAETDEPRLWRIFNKDSNWFTKHNRNNLNIRFKVGNLTKADRAVKSKTRQR